MSAIEMTDLALVTPISHPLQVEMAAQSHVGRVRPSNQDNYHIEEDLGLILVADGMGGHQGGEVASELAAKTVRETVHSAHEITLDNAERVLLQAISRARDAIVEKASENPDLASMGTTLTCALVLDQEDILVGHLGDSRLYRLREGKLSLLTHDHNVLSELLRAGVLTDDQIQQNRHLGHLLTRVLCAQSESEPQVLYLRPQSGDRYLLCSDGLHGVVEDKTIEEILNKYNDNERACEVLIEAALENGAPDNVTTAILDTAHQA